MGGQPPLPRLTEPAPRAIIPKYIHRTAEGFVADCHRRAPGVMKSREAEQKV